MHSSKMRTIRHSGRLMEGAGSVCPGGLSARGIFCQGRMYAQEGVCAQGSVCPGGGWVSAWHTPVNRITDRCNKYAFQ